MQMQGVDTEMQRCRHRSRHEKLMRLLKLLEKLRRTPQVDDVAVSWGNVDSGERKHVLKYEEHSHHQDGMGQGALSWSLAQGSRWKLL